MKEIFTKPWNNKLQAAAYKVNTNERPLGVFTNLKGSITKYKES